MPVITDIRRQKRSEDRYSIYVDGQYSFALSDLEFSGSDLHLGLELTEAEIVRYQAGSEHSKSYAMAVRFLAVRMRSRREVADYLSRKGQDEEEVQAVVERLERAALIDDRKFAQNWVAERQMLRPRSRRMLEQELQAKGVGRLDIEVALAELDRDDEVVVLAGVIRKKQKLRQYQDEPKLIGYLLRQGYEFDLIKKALARLSEK